jgi:hypothetical protein
MQRQGHKLSVATGTDLSTATAKADSQNKAPSAHIIHGRNVQVATSSWTSTAAVAVTFTGTDIHGTPNVTEVITIPSGGTTVQGLVGWLDAPTATSWTTPAGWTAGTFKWQSGTKLALPAAPGTTINVLKEVGYVDASPTPAVATLGTTDGTNATYIPTTALDGSHDIEVWYTEAPAVLTSGGSTVTVNITDTGHAHAGVAHTHALA